MSVQAPMENAERIVAGSVGPTPRVSVIMAVYNQQLYLREAIESLFAQTWTDFEIVAVNDGSTDRSLKILEEFAARDSRIVVVDQENRGRAATRQRGLELARGEYVAVMDPDDVAWPRRLERHVAFLDTHPEVVCAGAENVRICPFGMEIAGSVHPRSHEKILDAYRRGDGEALSQPCCMYRRTAALNAGGYNLKLNYGEDVEFFLRLARVGRLASLPWPAVQYRQHPQSANHTRSKADVEALRSALRDLGYDWDAVLKAPSQLVGETQHETFARFHLRCARIAMQRADVRFCMQHLWNVGVRGAWTPAVIREAVSIAKDCVFNRLQEFCWGPRVNRRQACGGALGHE